MMRGHYFYEKKKKKKKVSFSHVRSRSFLSLPKGSVYLVNKPLSAADISEDNAQG